MDLNKLEIRGRESGAFTIVDKRLTLSAFEKTDWFHHPTDEFRKNNVLALAMPVREERFTLKARVSVDFKSPYDAGALFIQVDEENWAKLGFEYSGDRKPTVVSVVTRTTSDDCDGPNHFGSDAWLRIYCDKDTVAFHFSEDGKYWRFLRWFAIPGVATRPLTIGFGVQAPTGSACTATFNDIALSYEKISDLRNGS
jgi:regulation of enolase protein 1 (concanavalin A-like superfamily)